MKVYSLALLAALVGFLAYQWFSTDSVAIVEPTQEQLEEMYGLRGLPSVPLSPI